MTQLVTQPVRFAVTAEVTSISEVDCVATVEGYVYFDAPIRPGSERFSNPSFVNDNRLTSPGGTHPNQSQLDEFISKGDIVPFEQSSLFLNGTNGIFAPTEFEIRGGIIRGLIGYTITILTKFDYSRLPYDKHYLTMLLQFNNKFMESWGENIPAFQNLPYMPDDTPDSWFFNGRWAMSFSIFHGGLASKWDTTNMETRILQIELETDTANGIQPKWRPNTHLVVAIPFKRKPTFFLMNIVVPTFFLTGLGLIAFGYGAEGLADRLSCILTLLLSSLAFKGAISSYMPVQNRTTLLDFYVVTSFTLLSMSAFVCLGSYVIQGWFLSFEKAFVALYGAVWLLSSFVVFVPGTLLRSWESILDLAIGMLQESQKSYSYVRQVRIWHHQ